MKDKLLNKMLLTASVLYVFTVVYNELSIFSFVSLAFLGSFLITIIPVICGIIIGIELNKK